MTLLDLREPTAPRAERVPPALPATAPEHAETSVAGTPERVGWSVAAVVGLFGLLHAWTASIASPVSAVLTPVLVVGAMLGLVRLWTARSIGRLLQLGLCAITAAGLCLRALQMARVTPGYGTDALAFNEYAARLLLEGTNPYTASLAPSLELFQVPPDYSTFRLDGSAVDMLSYPAGAVLAYVPPLLLGMESHGGTAVNLVCWLAAGLLLWRLLPAALRWLAPVLLGLSVYSEYVVGGVTDAVWLPFVILALHRWDRFAGPAGGLVRWLGPLSLGIAMSTKQTPWFLLPFLLVALGVEARARGRSAVAVPAAYLGAALAAFTAINLPFAVWAPSAWLAGAVLPLVESTVPDGQGLVSLAVYAGLGGGSLTLFSVAGALFVGGALAALLLHYDRLKRAWVLLVPLAFVFPTRSLASYLIMLLPAALLAAVSVGPAPAARPRPGRWSRLVPGALLGGAAFAAAAALVLPPPVTVEVLDVRSTGAWQTVSEVVVRVHNRSGQELPVSFTLNDDGRTTSFWEASDPSPVPGGAVRDVTLLAPDVASMPDVGTPFRVLAFTGAPAAVSSSDPYAVSRLSVSLSPMAVPGEVRTGQPLVLTAQVRNERGVPVARSGVPVSLSQVVYAEAALLPGNTSINGGPQGQSPAQVVTDGQGRAQFVVNAVQAQRDPVYFQAWISADGAAPHGYSRSVLIRFVP